MQNTLTLTAVALVLMTGSAFAQGKPGAHFIENFDLDEDGVVTLAEVLEKRTDIFYMFDQDENGVLSSEEYDMFDEVRAADHEQEGHSGGQGQGNQGEGMAREVTDLNGDGVVAQEEFMTAAQDWFQGKDRNRDGVITTADFGPRG